MDIPPTEESTTEYPWQKAHRPNLTGTPEALRPSGSTLAEGRRPHAIQELPQPVQALGPGPVEPPGALPPLGQQSGVLQHAQVLADRGPRHVERGGDLPRGQLVIGDEPQDGAAPWLGDRLQGLVGRVPAPGRIPARARAKIGRASCRESV